MKKLAIFTTHPIQYYAPLFRTLANRIDLEVFYGRRSTPQDQAQAGFDHEFEWDIDLLSGYRHRFLANVARRPGIDRFTAIDTPEVDAILRDGRFDAVLVFGWYRKMLMQAVIAAKRHGLPVMARGDSQLGTPRSFAKRALKLATYPAFLRLFDAALVVGERNRAYWRHYAYPAHRIFLSPHCVDTEWFAARATDGARAALRAECGFTDATKAVLFAGKLTELKRPFDVLEAVAKVREKGRPAEMLVAGSGPLDAELRAHAARLGVPLHPLGFRNQSQMPQVYAAADILVLPSSSETWGLVVNEALACGCPVAVSDAVGCAPDLAAVGSAARSYPVGDVAACALAIESVLTARSSCREATGSGSFGSLEAAADGIVAALQFVTREDRNRR